MHVTNRRRAGLLSVLLVVAAACALATDARAASRVRLVSPPASATPGERIALTIRGPRSGRVRVYLSRRSRPPRGARPKAKARLRRGRARVTVTVPASLSGVTRRIVPCLRVRHRLRCGRSAVVRIASAAADTGPPAAGIPAPSIYAITLQGVVGAGSGRTPFAQSALLLLVPTVDPAAATGNSVNPVDIGIKTAASPIIGVAGALWFGTNLGVSAVIGSSPAVGLSAVDVAFVSAAGTHVEVTLDGNVFGLPFARVDYLNIYNVQTSIVAQIHNVLTGRLALDVTQGGAAVQGQIALGGTSGFNGPTVSSLYAASFTGVRVR